MARARDLHSAKLAEQAERYDEMADYMEKVGNAGGELSVYERSLLSVAYKNAVGSRRAAWRIVSSVKQKETAKGNEENAMYAKEQLTKIESELQLFCGKVLALLETNLIPAASNGESKVFYQKMMADYHRYVAEFTVGDKRSAAIESARMAYEEAKKLAEKELVVTHSIRLGVALNFSVFQYEVLANPGEACKIAFSAFEDAIAELDDTSDQNYMDNTIIMQLLRDNLIFWTSEQEGCAES